MLMLGTYVCACTMYHLQPYTWRAYCLSDNDIVWYHISIAVMNSVEIVGETDVTTDSAVIVVNTSGCPVESDDELQLVVEYTHLSNGVTQIATQPFERNIAGLRIALNQLHPGTTFSYAVSTRRKVEMTIIGEQRLGTFQTGRMLLSESC